MSSASTNHELVYIDPLTGLYHDAQRHAGPSPLSCTRAQAPLLGAEPCPDCYRGADR